MVKDIKITQVCTDSLACEPLIERMPNGELLCVCQLGGTSEPAPENRVYFFHSKDEGETWSERKSIYPEDGQAVYCTELSVIDDEVTAYLTVHTGRFLDWKCYMMKSFDNGYTWKNYGNPLFFPEYTFIRGMYTTKSGRILLPYQNYPVTKEEHDRILQEEIDKGIWVNTQTPYCDTGVLISDDGGKTYEKFTACQVPMASVGAWAWTEPTVAELSDGTIVMLTRRCGSGWLFRCESKDGGKTWSERIQTDIPNPSNKPKLFNLPDGRIALIHTPNSHHMTKPPYKYALRYPYELWISDDDMQSWGEKIRLTDFPGEYSYTDGFYEDGHLRFVVEHNRHTVLYFDVTL